MPEFTFNATLDGTGTVVWKPPRPRDEKRIRVGDILHFHVTPGDTLLLMFRVDSPFSKQPPTAKNPLPGPPFIYASENGDLSLEVFGPPSKVYDFDCGITASARLQGLDKAGDQIPVGP